MNPTPKLYQSRREKVLQAIGQQGLALIFSGYEKVRNNDCHYPFRPHSAFYYLSGFEEPEALLILDGESGDTSLLCRPKDALREIWDGFRYGPEGAKEAFGFDKADDIANKNQQLAQKLQSQKTVYAFWDDVEQIQAFQACLPPDVSRAPLNILLNPLREIKDASEQALIKKACEISALAHIRAMQNTRPDLFEYHIEAHLQYEFMRHGARFAAYNHIVASGQNACCLHYGLNHERLKNGDLLLIDSGAEYHYYAGDITRTFPVNGHFTAAQKDLYNIVLEANEQAILAVKPGVRWQEISAIATRILTQGLLDLKLLAGSLESNLEQATYRRFYMHGLGHPLGLDVHDTDQHLPRISDTPLQSGMVFTIEPGLYIPNDSDLPEAFRGTGIRVEDDILVTETAHENLTALAPKSIAAIESLMQNAGA